MTYDHPMIADLRKAGRTWHDIAGHLDLDPKRVRQAHSTWQKRQRDGSEKQGGGTVIQKWLRTDEGTIHVKMPDGTAGMTMEDLSRTFWDESMEAFEGWVPSKEPPPIVIPSSGGLAVPSLYDAHFGMKADGAEIAGGVSQDLKIISGEFDAAARGLVSLSRMYDPAAYLIPLGHDFSHVNQYMGKALTTRSGTEQDVDSRLWKIHRAVCQSAVRLIDEARSTGRIVYVSMVPGNHDPDENQKLGEFLKAWFRHDEGVVIDNEPRVHKYFGWQNNAFMLTHGEHYLKKNGQSPIMVFAAQCPPDIWARGHAGGRYILSGHLHARRKGQYTPTSEMQEEQGIITYVLPGLTATDDWHYRQNYSHSRAATLQIFRPEGGLHGQHEVNP